MQSYRLEHFGSLEGLRLVNEENRSQGAIRF